MNRITIALAALLLTLAAGALAQDGVVLAVLPAEAHHQPGDTLTVDLAVLVAGDAFNAYDAYIEYDAERLELLPLDPVTAQEGPLMTAACPQRFHDFAGSAPGQAIVHHGLLCAGAAVTGPGVVYRLRFRCRDLGGTARIDLVAGTGFFNDGLLVQPVAVHGAEIVVDIGTAAPSPAAVAPTMRAAPNPFNPRTEIRLSGLPAGAFVVEILTLDGRRVTVRIVESTGRSQQSLTWDGRDASGREAPSGVYLAVVRRSGRILASTGLTLIR